MSTDRPRAGADLALIDTVPLRTMELDNPAPGLGRPSVLLWVLVTLPALAGLVGAVMVLDSPLEVVLTAKLPAVIVVGGVEVSLVAGLWPWRRRQARRRAVAAAQAVRAQAVARDRRCTTNGCGCCCAWTTS